METLFTKGYPLGITANKLLALSLVSPFVVG